MEARMEQAVICYFIAGGLMACAGALYISQYGYIAPATGLSSSSFIMSAFLPMFIGGALAFQPARCHSEGRRPEES